MKRTHSPLVILTLRVTSSLPSPSLLPPLLPVLYYSVIHGLPQFADPSLMPEAVAPIDPNTPPPTLADLGSFLSSLLEHNQVSSHPGLENNKMQHPASDY